MSKGYFTNKTDKPEEKDIKNIIGLSHNKWVSLIHHLQDELKLKGEFKFYGVNYGWALRFNKSGKSVIALYPGKDSFTIQIILDKMQVKYALLENINPEIKTIIKETESIHEGKWIYIRIDEFMDLTDVINLIDIRIKIKMNK